MSTDDFQVASLRRAVSHLYPSPFGGSMPTAARSESRVEETNEGVVVLAVGTLANDAAPISEELARLAAAEAVLVDLREAHGDDLRAVWPAVEAIVDRGPVRPIREVRSVDGLAAEASRERFGNLHGERRAFDPASLSWLRGDGRGLPDRAAPYDPAARFVAVVAGEDCGLGCDLIARTLAHYGGRAYFDSRGYFPRGSTCRRTASLANPGVFELASVGCRVTFPTTRIDLDLSTFFWRRGGEEAAVRMHATVAGWRRSFASRHGNESVPACETLPPVPEGQETPVGWSSRTERIVGGCPDCDDGSFAAVVLEHPLEEAAEAYVTGCPGLEVRGTHPGTGAFGVERGWETVLHVWGTTHDLSRLVASPLLLNMSRQRGSAPQPN